MQKRPPRRLTTRRLTAPLVAPKPPDEGEEEEEVPDEAESTPAPRRRHTDEAPRRPDAASAPRPSRTEPKGLAPAAASGSINKARKVAGAGKKKATTQMTLNLDMRPGFVECPGCGMVYNARHAGDVAMHKRRHGAMAVARRTAAGDS